MARYQKSKKSRNVKKPKILMIADGETEINYITGLIDKLDLKHHYHIETKPKMVNTSKIMKHVKMVYHSYDFVFAFSDKDNINNRNDVYNEMCQIDDIYDNVIPGYSNPCFEVWLYLHNSYRETEISVNELVKQFEKQIGKKYKTDPFIFTHFETSLDQAIENAKKLSDFWKEFQPDKSICERNPDTGVSNVIICIQDLNKKG